MEKDASFWIDWYRDEFTKNMDELKRVESHEQRKELVARIEAIKDRLKEKDPEFSKFTNARQVNRSQRVASLEERAFKLREETSAVGAYVPNRSPKSRVICCPKCFSLDNDNKTNRLNRKQRRSKPMIKGYPVHDTAFCVSCNSRMVKMPEKERQLQLSHKA